MADAANDSNSQPPCDFMDCGGDTPGPTFAVRRRGFDFRAACEARELPVLPQEAEAKGVQAGRQAMREGRKGGGAVGRGRRGGG